MSSEHYHLVTMPKTSERATIYFDPDLHTALRLKAVTTDRSLSDIVNEAVAQALHEDQEEPSVPTSRLRVTSCSSTS